jgi:hypothetical protein
MALLLPIIVYNRPKSRLTGLHTGRLFFQLVPADLLEYYIKKELDNNADEVDIFTLHIFFISKKIPFTPTCM